MSISPNPLFDEAERLRTFQDKGWPLSFLKPEDLAKSGFYYTGFEDKVKCPFCNTVVFNWNNGDNPIMEHIMHSRRCLFINGYEVGNIPIDADPRVIFGLAPPRDVCGSTYKPKVDEPKKVNEPGKKYTPPKHNEYITFDSRLATFKDWPISQIIKPANLAEAGFFYKGPALFEDKFEFIDYVICFHCGIDLCQWKEGDDAWKEHEKYSKDCNYLYLLKVKNLSADALNTPVSETQIEPVEASEPIKQSPVKSPQSPITSPESSVSVPSTSDSSSSVTPTSESSPSVPSTSESSSSVTPTSESSVSVTPTSESSPSVPSTSESSSVTPPSESSTSVPSTSESSSVTPPSESSTSESALSASPPSESALSASPPSESSPSEIPPSTSESNSELTLESTSESTEVKESSSIPASSESKDPPPSCPCSEEKESTCKLLDSSVPFKWLPKAEESSFRCSVCLEFRIGVAFHPCLHTACPPCAAALSNCPICRTPIERVKTLSEINDSKEKEIFYYN